MSSSRKLRRRDFAGAVALARDVYGYPVSTADWLSWASPLRQGVQGLPPQVRSAVLRLARQIIKDAKTYVNKNN